jgi:alpha-glucuronidase
MIGCAGEKETISASPVKSISIVLPKNSGPVMQNIASVFTRRVEKRCVKKISTSGNAEMKVELLIDEGIGAEGFRITEAKNVDIRIAGNDQLGVIYGVVKFLRTSTYGKDGFIA